jgi:tetratricopeptide (TPR) repeat protein
MRINPYYIFLSLFLFLSCVQNNSDTIEQIKESATSNSTYLNHAEAVSYVGMNTCRQCHANIYNTYIETGMGKSFFLATREKSSADFVRPFVHDQYSDYRYTAFWKKDSLYFEEYKLEGKDTIHKRIEQVNFIIGSGQHTNSHLQNLKGYIHQMPMTYYTQKKKWDLPPGFEDGFNTHFSRKIGLECMSCHNAFPEFVLGSENKYKSLPLGIDCERCHGPGSIHVEQRQTKERIDTSKYIDYSIVNPAKLPVDLQFDICQRCHLQGNAVLKEGKSFYDFRPGQKLSDVISVFLPKYENANEEFIMASHADRLKQSACFIKSLERSKGTNSLKPYKDAMTCVTCHNPHVSVKHTEKNSFNKACNNCHNSDVKTILTCTDKKVIAAKNSKHTNASDKFLNCVGCHMPASGSTDIPHVSVHDHFIRKPITTIEKDKIKKFLGLFSINEQNPSRYTRAKAYLQQYEKFEQKTEYLDSALSLLKQDLSKEGIEKNIHLLVQTYFMKQNFQQVITFVRDIGEKKCLEQIFKNQSYENTDAWACYRVAESFSSQGDQTSALLWFQHAVKLAPYNPDFRNKLGSSYASNNNIIAALEQFEFIIKENPKYVSGYCNLGFIKLQQGFPAEALRLYTLGLSLDPEYEPLLMNMAGYFAFQNNKKEAVNYLQKILKKNPGNQKAKVALQQITARL